MVLVVGRVDESFAVLEELLTAGASSCSTAAGVGCCRRRGSIVSSRVGLNLTEAPPSADEVRLIEGEDACCSVREDIELVWGR